VYTHPSTWNVSTMSRALNITRNSKKFHGQIPGRKSHSLPAGVLTWR